METEHTTTALVDAIEELRNHERIRQLLAAYCRCLDEYDIAGVAACFSDNAVADYGPGRGGAIHGRDNIAARIASGQKVFRRTHHQTGQILIDLRGNEADTTSYQITWHELQDGTQELVCLRYVDKLEMIDGTWLISDRRVEASLVNGFEGTQWNWVQRQQP
jgi:SnoaL-like domain